MHPRRSISCIKFVSRLPIKCEGKKLLIILFAEENAHFDRIAECETDAIAVKTYVLKDIVDDDRV